MSKGVIDGDPVALILLIYMAFVLMIWLGTSSTSINPIAGNTTITNQYSSAFTNTKWVLWLMLPFTIYMIADRGFDIRHKREREKEEEEIA